MGNKNNLVSVRQSDFEVFQALAKDIEEGNNNEQKEYTQVIKVKRLLGLIFADQIISLQEIPVNKPWEKITGPPVLPPQLLQVILNKDTPVSVSIIELLQ